MARVVGSFNKDTNYEVSIRKPIDARIVVPSYADLTTESNWLNEANKSIVYNGLIVAVVDTTDIEHSGVYYFYDVSFSALKGGTVTNIDNWIKLCSLNELNSLKTRVVALESITAITEEELNTAINALRTEIAEAGYLTADSLNGYATEAFVSDEISKLSIPEDTSSRVKEVEEGLASVSASVAEHSTDIENITARADLQDITIANLQSSISINETNIGTVESKVSDLEGVVDNKANKVDVQAQIDLLATKEVVDAKADKTYVDDELARKVDNEDLATKADKATTLSGYGIADAYTKDEANAEIARQITNAQLAGTEFNPEQLNGYYVSETEWTTRTAAFATNDNLGITQSEVDALEKNLNDNYSTTEQVKAMVNDHVVTTIAYGEF